MWRGHFCAETVQRVSSHKASAHDHRGQGQEQNRPRQRLGQIQRVPSHQELPPGVGVRVARDQVQDAGGGVVDVGGDAREGLPQPQRDAARRVAVPTPQKSGDAGRRNEQLKQAAAQQRAGFARPHQQNVTRLVEDQVHQIERVGLKRMHDALNDQYQCQDQT